MVNVKVLEFQSFFYFLLHFKLALGDLDIKMYLVNGRILVLFLTFLSLF